MRFDPSAPWYRPYAHIIASWDGCVPGAQLIERLNQAALGSGAHEAPLQFHAQQHAASGADYELEIARTGSVPCRANWHDAWNAAVWLTFPKLKGAINAAHLAALAATSAARVGTRGRVRDAITVLDESGALFITDDAQTANALLGFDWNALFVSHREQFAKHVSVFVVGHGMLERLANPYLALTAHAMVLAAPSGLLQQSEQTQRRWADAQGAALIADLALDGCKPWSPLPLLGIPSWWGANCEAGFYANSAVFRPGRSANGASRWPPRRS